MDHRTPGRAFGSLFWIQELIPITRRCKIPPYRHHLDSPYATKITAIAPGPTAKLSWLAATSICSLERTLRPLGQTISRPMIALGTDPRSRRSQRESAQPDPPKRSLASHHVLISVITKFMVLPAS